MSGAFSSAAAAKSVSRSWAARRRKSLATLPIIEATQVLSKYVTRVVQHEHTLAQIQANGVGEGFSGQQEAQEEQEEFLRKNEREAAIAKVFEEFDADGSGAVDCEEFIAGMAKIKDEDDPPDLFKRSSLESVFIRFDLNGSGSIDIQEFKGILSSSNAASTVFIDRTKAADAKVNALRKAKADEAQAKARRNASTLAEKAKRERAKEKADKIASMKAQKADRDAAIQAQLEEAQKRAEEEMRKKKVKDEQEKKAQEAKKQEFERRAEMIEKQAIAKRAAEAAASLDLADFKDKAELQKLARKRATKERQAHLWKEKHEEAAALREEVAKARQGVTFMVTPDDDPGEIDFVPRRRSPSQAAALARAAQGSPRKGTQQSSRPSLTNNRSIFSNGALGSLTWAPITSTEVIQIQERVTAGMQNGGRPNSSHNRSWRLTAEQAQANRYEQAQASRHPRRRRSLLERNASYSLKSRGAMPAVRTRPPFAARDTLVSGLWLPEAPEIPWGVAQEQQHGPKTRVTRL